MVVILHSAYRLLLMVMLTIWARAETEDLTCAQKGGTCVPEDDSSCSHEVDYPGCDEDERCCISLPGSLRQNMTADPCGILDCCQEESYKGICRMECPEDRFQTGDCNEECKCCGCKIKNECRKKDGHCIRKDIDTCDGKTKDSWCNGRMCTCCIPKCPQNEACLDANGRCDESCNDNEEPNNDIQCINKNCVCCVPKKCANSVCCEAAGGYCNNTCPLGSIEDKTLCDGIECTCCLPTPFYECPCSNNKECASVGGHCDHRCEAGERANTDRPCEGKSCVCCVPDYPCKGTKVCHSVNGRCDERCNDDEVVDTNAPCSGDSCVCCVPKSDCGCTEECLDAKGYCDVYCGRDEIRNVSIPCLGENCACCVPKSCEGSKCPNGGICRSQCATNESPTRTTSEDDGCPGDCLCCQACCTFENQLYSSGCIRYQDCDPIRCEDGQWLPGNITSTGSILCPDPFTKVGEECFYRSDMDVSKNWNDARDYCTGLGGDLATPQNVPLLREYLADIGMPIAVWIGAYVEDLPANWRYFNGQPINPCDWSATQPDNAVNEHCLEIRRYFTPPLNNYYCYKLQGFICQYGAIGCDDCE